MKINAGSAQPVQQLEGRTPRWLAHASLGAAGTALLENVIASAGAVPPHSHPMEELLVCQEGDGQLVACPHRYPFRPGDTAIIGAEEVQSIENTGAAPLRLLGFFPSARPTAQMAVDGPPLLVER